MSLGEAQGVRVIPSELHWENYAVAWDRANFTEYFVNSVLITVITLAGELTVCILAAYAFARMKFPGRNILVFAHACIPPHTFCCRIIFG